MNTFLDKEIKLRLLKLLEENPKLSQREMNKKMGVSLGKINYCISALSKKGMIRIERFKKHPRKIAYIYRLTPKGAEELSRLTLNFLKLKIKEYERLKKEIAFLSSEIDVMTTNSVDYPELVKKLRKII